MSGHTVGDLIVDDGGSNCVGLFSKDTGAEIAYLSANAEYGSTLQGPEIDRANAARLARCWNTHDELVRALTDLVDCGAEAWGDDRPCVRVGRAALTRAQEADRG